MVVCVCVSELCVSEMTLLAVKVIKADLHNLILTYLSKVNIDTRTGFGFPEIDRYFGLEFTLNQHITLVGPPNRMLNEAIAEFILAVQHNPCPCIVDRADPLRF